MDDIFASQRKAFKTNNALSKNTNKFNIVAFKLFLEWLAFKIFLGMTS